MQRYLINQSSATKFSVEAVPKHLRESFLMMIISIAAGIIDTTYIKHCIQ